MAEIGLFPLGLVLLPSERVPLHIFEPRYKELIDECLEQEREFGILLADEDGVREVGTRAAVVDVLERFDDGRLNVVVEGRERFRVVTLTEGRSFHTAEVESLADEGEPPNDAEVTRALDLFTRLAKAAEAEVETPTPPPERLSFELASHIDFGVEPKQELLELRSERERLKKLTELLEAGLQAVALERQMRERASGNGKVSSLPRFRTDD